MKLLEGKEHLSGEYHWMRSITSPQRIIQSFMEVTPIVCAVAGTKPLVVGDTIWGSLPGKPGYISLYTTRENIYDLALADPNIHYYWDRESPKAGIVNPPRVTIYNKGRPSADEPWLTWSEEVIQQKLIKVCHDSFLMPIDEACMIHSLSHWAFKELFSSRYPEQWMRYEHYKEIPTQSDLAKVLARRFPTMSCVG